jgi:hypothetical protein
MYGLRRCSEDIQCIVSNGASGPARAVAKTYNVSTQTGLAGPLELSSPSRTHGNATAFVTTAHIGGSAGTVGQLKKQVPSHRQQHSYLRLP